MNIIPCFLLPSAHSTCMPVPPSLRYAADDRPIAEMVPEVKKHLKLAKAMEEVYMYIYMCVCVCVCVYIYIYIYIYIYK